MVRVLEYIGNSPLRGWLQGGESDRNWRRSLLAYFLTLLAAPLETIWRILFQSQAESLAERSIVRVLADQAVDHAVNNLLYSVHSNPPLSERQSALIARSNRNTCRQSIKAKCSTPSEPHQHRIASRSQAPRASRANSDRGNALWTA
jgi:hypothetical protein